MVGINRPPAETFPRLHKAMQVERVWNDRPNYLGAPLINSDIYAAWFETTQGLGLDEERLRELQEDINLEMIPKTWGDFYTQTVDSYDSQEEAALSVNSMEGASSTFLLGYTEVLADDPYIKENGLDPFLAAKARIEYWIRSKSAEERHTIDFANENKYLSAWKHVLGQNLENTISAAVSFIEHLPECLTT